MIEISKRIKAKGGIDLRIIARGRDKSAAAEAEAELKRRLGNLRGAVVPEWELAARGPHVLKWAVL